MSDCTQCADYEWCAKNEECGMFKQKQMTKADRIRSMTDEELAAWMVRWTDCYECVARTIGCCQSDESCASSICNWLKMEAET